MTTPPTLEQIAAIVHRLQSFGRRICWHKEVIFNSNDQQKLHELLDDAGNALAALQTATSQQATGGDWAEAAAEELHGEYHREWLDHIADQERAGVMKPSPEHKAEYQRLFEKAEAERQRIAAIILKHAPK